ncbi:MAG TPA: MarR family winged helix-turn-helix transcriptional regulator [Enteractinococcus helveticum]|uniref:MarR family winged helix-turn-helix transcriptional regulator n=1 Tax=Enteractinococcus helveticum TaxID=1837282 RepID=A0A921FQX9_9MICC|nr:MarR family winged helix-turn-helix transcriptional regulator [Enteractinococcus helveticum]HJF15542.1 MarR family winged helix-turn-helix transcriptional regulator [Enteractinococcus helveticum]
MTSSLTTLTTHELQQPLGPAFRMYFETTARLLDRLEKRLKQQVGLTLSEYNMLLLLSEAPEGHMRMGQLADAIVFSPSRLTYQVKVLSDRGLVKRVKCADDGRAWQAELTAEGRTMFRKASVIHAKGVKALFTDVVSEDELATIYRTFAKVCAQLNEIPED